MPTCNAHIRTDIVRDLNGRPLDGRQDAGFHNPQRAFRPVCEVAGRSCGSEVNDPNAMSLATVDADGLPNVRMVLLKGFDENGFVFYTNLKARREPRSLGT
jgi:pyridoxine/pyridoxamine 5'-phosphate oxidase